MKKNEQTTVSMYQKPVVLNAEAHKNLKFTPISKFDFAKGLTSTVLLASEFMMVAKELPIVFTKTTEETWDALAVLSIKSGENVFVAEDGTWQGNYIPALLRRYPFVLTKNEKDDNFTVCFDEASNCFNEKEGELLFTETGEQTATMQNIMKYLNDFQSQYAMTQSFTKKLVELELLREIQGTFTINKEQQYALNGMWVVDEEKLMKLDDATMVELVKTGMMAWINFHLMSLSNLNMVANKFAQTQEKAA